MRNDEFSRRSNVIKLRHLGEQLELHSPDQRSLAFLSGSKPLIDANER